MIYILLFVFGIISSGIWMLLNRTKQIGYLVRTIFFFFYTYYFVVSAIKLYLGSPQNTLIESFWDAQKYTYIHYAGLFVPISIMVPVIGKVLFKAKGVRLINLAVEYITVAGLTALIFKGKISNECYCFAYAIGLTISLIINIYYKGELLYFKRCDYKKVVLKGLSGIIAWAVTIGIYLPNELFINNIEEFSGGYVSFLIIMVTGSIVCSILFILLQLLLFSEVWFKVLSLLVGGTICIGYVQNMFLNGSLTVLDGEEQIWSDFVQVGNMAIWVLIIGTIVIVGYKRQFIYKAVQYVCIYIALIQLVSFGYLLMTADFTTYQRVEMSSEGALELAQDENVLVFVLDNFDSSWFEEILEEDTAFADPLADFTYYRNGTSQFAHTADAIPYMLTGVEWNEEIEGSYAKYAYKTSDAMQYLAKSGCEMGIYTHSSYLNEFIFDIADNYMEGVKSRYHFVDTYLTMVKTSMYKIMPFCIKAKYRYYSDEISDMSYQEGIWSIDNDLIFYDSLVDEGVSIKKGTRKAFRIYHMRGPHAPFYLSDDLKCDVTGREVTRASQGRGSMRIVYEYLEQLKKLNKYDDATIIITADHGQGNILDSEKSSGKPDRTSRPIFIIKEANEHSNKMKISYAPVSQAELIPTIMQAMGLEWQKYGRTFKDIQENEERERTYVDIYRNFVIQYVINGDASDIENWNIKYAVYN